LPGRRCRSDLVFERAIHLEAMCFALAVRGRSRMLRPRGVSGISHRALPRPKKTARGEHGTAGRFAKGLASTTRMADQYQQPATGRVTRAVSSPIVEWDAEMNNEHENELLAWRSVPGSRRAPPGSVRFQSLPADRGTIVPISLKYDPPGGKATARVARFLGHGLEQSVREDLRRFKQLMEADEVAATERQPQGSCPRSGRHSLMKAVCWCGGGDVRVERVPDPKLINPRDAIVRVTRTGIDRIPERLQLARTGRWCCNPLE
jgi:Alcohol dehydrogenase GroES-associated